MKKAVEKYAEFEKQVGENIGLARVFLRDDVEAMDQSHAIAIVFAAMCLEAFIYDYAVHNFSRNFVTTYIDKLDLRAKWVIIPQLVTGKKFDTSGKAFHLLGKLVQYRNEIVHAKSTRRPPAGEFKKIIEGKAPAEDKLTMITNSCNAIKELIRELDKMDDRKHKPWWWEVMKGGIGGGECEKPS